MDKLKGAYGADSHIVDYILGITFEIWEQRGLDLIRQYYAPSCAIYSLDGLVGDAEAVVQGTEAMLEAYPDRVLLAEAVIWSLEANGDYYSSHRILSEMTSVGATAFGPATGAQVRIRNVADCVVRQGQIVKEWLVRDNLALVQQLGVDPKIAAQTLADAQTPQLMQWLAEEHRRLGHDGHLSADISPSIPDPRAQPEAFARTALGALWGGDFATAAKCYAPYAVQHRHPLRRYSGLDEIVGQYQEMRGIFGPLAFSVDHVASQPFSDAGVDIAVRWMLSGEHQAALNGLAASGHPLVILGVTHLHCVDGRVVQESTVFDELAVMGQVLSPIALS